ncbi:Hypothetical predicted protein [Lecanosticta acicola]|uniref:Abscission/NoCut checkpoint regulator n=1 Tax=Lecanosticta acicola TaxID=111012 RepID=A0AAI9EE48_9PEZI|nr:Hypothetical predicted protein [Lecanosticta acicola]
MDNSITSSIANPLFHVYRDREYPISSDMPGKDDDLLARLNAAKPSSVKLNPAAPSVEIQTSEPHTVEDKLAERLKTLRSGGSVNSSPKSQDRFSQNSLSPAARLTSRVKDKVAAEHDPIRDWRQQDGDEQTLEELLAELGPDDQWKLDPEDPKDINALLKEAKEALPTEIEQSELRQNGHGREFDEQFQSEDGNESTDQKHDEAKNDEAKDEENADDYVKRVLAEVEYERKYGGDDADDAVHTEQERNGDPLNLPSTPSNLPEPTTFVSEPAPSSKEDDDLQARFSKLGLGGLDLPSTPTSKPSANTKVTAHGKPKSNLPVYTDEDIESWCCICNEDGQVRCLGCDGDIYCQNCWRDGHGNGPGQERGHRAVQYNNRKGSASAA